MSYGMDGWNKPSGDSISREAAIDALDDYILDEVTDSHGDSVREILERLPAAQPERVRGEWLDDIQEDRHPLFRCGWRCSACGNRQTYGKTKYCPNCGADMREDDHG